MARIIGKGRYATETYPERGSGSGSGSGALIQVGYDGTVEEFEIASGNTYIPRNSALDPLQVTFPSFTLGNTLEVDFKLNGAVSAEEPTTSQVGTQIAVSLDGGATFYTLTPSGTLMGVTTDSGADNIILLRSLDAIQIVDPMPVVVSGIPGTIPVTASPIVRVFYQYGDDTMLVLINGGTDELTLPGAILKCSELAAASVFQGPLGQLATT